MQDAVRTRRTSNQAGAILTIDLGAIRENYPQLLQARELTAAQLRCRGEGRRLRARRGAGCARRCCKEGCEVVLRRACRGRAFAAPGARRRSRRSSSSTASFPARKTTARRRADRGREQRRAACGLARRRRGGAAERCRWRCRSTAACRGSAWRRPRSRRRRRCRRVRRPRSQAGDEPSRLRRRARQPGQRGAAPAPSRRCARKLPPAPASLANSSGIFLGKDFHYDLARPGAALYGVNPTPGKPNPMRPVVRLQAKVIQTRELEAGHRRRLRPCVPHRGAAHASPRSRSAMPTAGRAAAAASAWFDGVRLPFAGRVSMDSIILDISALPPGRLKAGDLVELIGPQPDGRRTWPRSPARSATRS